MLVTSDAQLIITNSPCFFNKIILAMVVAYSQFHWYMGSLFFPRTYQTLWKKLGQLQVLQRCVSKVKSSIHCHISVMQSYILEIFCSSFSHYVHYFFCAHRSVSETFSHNRVDVQTTKPQICMFIFCTTSKKTILDTWVHYWYVNKFLECLIIDK